MVALLAILVGCAPTPSSVKFDGEQVVTVHTVDAVDVAKATVLDKDGNAIEPQPTLTWSVNPPAVAALEGTKVKPVANGEATVEAKIGEVVGSYKFVVALPDKVEIAGYTAGTPIPVGATTMLTGKVLAGDKAIEGQTVTWTSANEAVATVAADGTVTGVTEGTATITGTAGTLTSTVDVTVGGAVAAADPAAAPAQ